MTYLEKLNKHWEAAKAPRSGNAPTVISTFLPREYARLTSFPDEYIFAGEWHEAYARIGNSVPPLLARAIAQNVRDTVLDER